ncbi:Protein of unknown function DUF3618 [Rhizobium sp. CF080]|uniref:DUF3618 domain-containing protein n=1 Tax=Rhizobium sp. (strain CF080) TaxID=1144310 RepID=UPI000271CD12|nr:DUF3618 domain-containing protein [Rhizobium sp. CF080]EUB98334.1 Protein of unknown function DUF3618 [Rhizobium sp. CF080]
MAYTAEIPKSVEIEREIEQDRQRIEDRIDAIQQRMSPGQLVDEVMAYAKSSGGGEYVGNLGNAMKKNPIPVALIGVSLAWLMAGPKNNVAGGNEGERDYPLAPIHGDIRRIGPVEQDGGGRYSHFADGTGKRFKALTDETGRRAGHFMDERGRTFRGFADASGRQIHDIRDEAGKLFDDASGWASKTWQAVTDSAGKMRDAMSGAGRGSLDAGAQFNDAILKHFRDQPLVGGALAFAVGAAIGAALPHTRQEDEAVGAAADSVKDRLSAEASNTLDKAEGLASDVVDKAVLVAAEVHDVARDRIAEEASELKKG